MWGYNSHRLTKTGQWKIWKWKHESIVAQQSNLSTISVPCWPVDHLLLLLPVGHCTTSQSSDHHLVCGPWQRTDCSPVNSPVTRSHSNRAALGSTYHRCAANSSAVTSWCIMMTPSAHMSPSNSCSNSAVCTWLSCQRGGRRCSRTRVRKCLLKIYFYLKG